MTRALSEVTEILADLIAAPSPNPPGDCEAVALVCQKWLDLPGLLPRIIRAPDGTPNVLVTLGQGSGRLLVHSHYDTQPPGDLNSWTSGPYSPTIRDGKLFGRGAGDDKGSVAAQIAALRSLVRGGFLPSREVRFAFVADEESGGSRGTKFLVAQGELDCDAAIIGEQTDNQLAIGERGMAWIRVTFHGRAAHGALPDEGINAVLPAARFIDLLSSRLAPALTKRRPSALLPASSLNVGQVHGGIDVSIVPERAMVEIDRRIVPGESVAGCVAEMSALAIEAAIRFGIEEPIVEMFLGSDPFLTDSNHPFIARCQSGVERAGLSPVLAGYRQSSDARFLAARGIPIVIFGPSDPAVGHAANEHVAIIALEQAVTAIVGMILNVASDSY